MVEEIGSTPAGDIIINVGPQHPATHGVLHLVITIVSAGLSQLIFAFIYNRQYMNRMLTSGWRLDVSDENCELARRVLGIRTEPGAV